MTYLRCIMLALGFHFDWVNLIMDYGTTLLALLINGQVAKTFSPTRVIRQGDPLFS